MNFYQHQQRARQRSVLLGFYFVLAVVLTVAAINLIVYLAFSAAGPEPMTLTNWFAGGWWAWITSGVLLVIVGNTLWTSLRLAGGGPALARMLRARRIQPDTHDLDERRLCNIVEEMSIASGVPVPALYVLDSEAGINAFVAGTRPTETVLVVTRGALQTFSRDEMQGVVAHEYSHIFNRDMHLNIQLMGALAGLIAIGQIGRMLMHSGSRSGNRNTGQAVLLGVGVLLVGYIGTFFGSLIKAAISRQREFLADASAVQFTRNPAGIANALYRIEQHTAGSLLGHARAEDLGHFCFGESVHYVLSAVMATHPPLQQRIKAINPCFEPPLPRGNETATTGQTAQPGDGAPLSTPAPDTLAAASGAVPLAGLSGAAVAARVGTLTAQDLEHAHTLHAAIPAQIMTALHQPDAAAETLYALVLRDSARVAWGTVRAIFESAPGISAAAVEARAAALDGLPAQHRLPLINLALPALKLLEPAARVQFRATLADAIEADGRFSVFEFALKHIIDDHLADDAARTRPVRYFRFAAVAAELRLLLSVLAHSGSPVAASASAAYTQAWRPFALGEHGLLARSDCRLRELDAALDKLAALSPLLKSNVIQACADCVIHDFRVNAAEAELLQALALNLDCPLPPLGVTAWGQVLTIYNLHEQVVDS